MEIEDKIKQIEGLFGDIPNTARVECDGMTHYLHAILSENGIKHDCYEGWVTHESGAVLLLHRWIEWEGYTIDYRLRMWIKGDDTVPHGIFKAHDYSTVKYEGEKVELPGYTVAFMEAVSKPIRIPDGDISDDGVNWIYGKK